ncbi:MAG: histone H1-like repetitive region-containing protein, partial [Bacteroidales bacterium]|nr:histone H1-like repetitive region-containing protein [Bacteroidales bacterium]
KAPVKKVVAKKPAVKKAPAKKAPVKKAVVKKAPVKKAPVKKAVVKKAVVKKAPVKKAVVKKAPVKKAPVKKAPVKKTPVKKAPVKKVVAPKAPVKKAPVKKEVEKKVVAKKPVVKKEVEKKEEVKQPQVQPSALNVRKIKPNSVEKQTKSPVMMTNEKPKNVGVPSSISGKKRLVVSYGRMGEREDLEAAFKEKYPRGYSDYMGDLFKVDKPDGTSFYALTVETEDSVYLIKMELKIDNAEDAQKELFPDSDASDVPTEGETFPDDNTENMSDSDDDIE